MPAGRYHKSTTSAVASIGEGQTSVAVLRPFDRFAGRTDDATEGSLWIKHICIMPDQTASPATVIHKLSTGQLREQTWQMRQRFG